MMIKTLKKRILPIWVSYIFWVCVVGLALFYDISSDEKDHTIILTDGELGVICFKKEKFYCESIAAESTTLDLPNSIVDDNKALKSKLKRLKKPHCYTYQLISGKSITNTECVIKI
ncbi:hypothetical protein [Photobacterium leiognathi]|uniref:hypothetical protein n=1 Tax=Photobacterium leiognathi TaxID=553611 RepID=UPI0029828FA5|nr:hypothetical protein [Photobacterium leiognathi]